MQVVLAEYGLGALALYYLGPALLGAAFGSLRGFAGEVTAAQALDLVGSDGSAVIIDIRTEVGGKTGQNAHSLGLLHLATVLRMRQGLLAAA